MRKLVAGVIGLLAVCALPLMAQSAGNDTLAALLVEVRLLRQALERNASAPQVQLLGTRLTVQNARLQSALRDHEAARVALQEHTAAVGDFTERLEAATQALGRGAMTTAERQRLELQAANAKQSLTNLGAREAELRAREAALAAAVAEEQNQWLLLNRRMDEIERGLPR